MKRFHDLTVAHRVRETRDAIRVGLDVPLALRETFDFEAGQHVSVEIDIDGQPVRRTYSLCSPPGVWPLEIGVRLQEGGVFSGYVKDRLAVDQVISVMPPTGQFGLTLDPKRRRTCLAFAAGSGITPILALVAATLGVERRSRFLLFYGNRRQDSAMFVDDLFALKNRYPERLQLQFLFSREAQELPVMSGRLDAAKVRELHAAFWDGLDIDDAFVCGPGGMIDEVTATLEELGIAAERIHRERFGAPRAPGPAKQTWPVGARGQKDVTVAVIMDGQKREFLMPRDGPNLVDAAAEAGIELPYSCKGGVCSTCRTHLRAGRVDMPVNYALEPWEIERGFILACQSRPVDGDLIIDYDKS